MSEATLLHSVDDAARLLSVSRANLYRLMRDGRVRSVKIGRARRIPHTALCDYVAALDERQGGDHAPRRTA